MTRATCSYENQSQTFTYKTKRKFNLQYSNLYAARFKLLKPKLIAAARDTWGEKFPVRQLVDVGSGEECVVVGLLFRKMELQPGILKEICDEENVVPLPVSEKYAVDDDQVQLEFILKMFQLLLVGCI